MKPDLKSIFLGALNLLLGERADFGLIGAHGAKSIVEATFNIDEKLFKSWFDANDLDYDKSTIVRREINNQGRSRAFVNDIPVGLSLLKELTQRLVFIHSQHYTHSLRDKNFHREILDELIELGSDLDKFQAQFFHLRKAENDYKRKRRS